MNPDIVLHVSLLKDVHVGAKYPWPQDCFLQGSDSGLVFEQGTLSKAFEDPKVAHQIIANPNTVKHYTTAFLEAFPISPKTFIRGEGKTLEDAEDSAWEQFQRIINCKGHAFDRRGRTDSGGFCIHCKLFKSDSFEPLERCFICNKPTYYTTDRHHRFYCEQHKNSIAQEDKSYVQLLVEKTNALSPLGTLPPS